jgi:predicted AlkP superfamily phosphohydrolase/phosphomutase
MVSGYPTPDHRRAYTYPTALAQKLKPLFSYTPDQIGAAAPERQAAIYHEATFSAAENLIRLSQLPWNLFFFVFGATDGAQHRFFKYVTADYPGVTDRDRARYGHLLDEVMVTADAALGRLLSHLPADTDILVISDHGGMARPTRAFNTNAWLASEGWLIPRSDIASPLRAAAQRSVEWAKQRLPVAEWVKRTLPSHAKRAIGTWRSGTGNILWEGTVAYRVKLSHPVEGIHLNVRGRQPLGVVPYRHYERVRAEIIAQLWQRAEVVSVQRREEVYHGPFADRAPDILFRLRSDVDSGAGLAEINTVVPTSWLQTISGYHTLGGILVATGPSFRSGAPTSSSLVDIAPTVLHTLGLAVPSGMDGRVLTEILAQERAVVIRPPLDERCPNAAQLGSADEAGLAAALRSLGYID